MTTTPVPTTGELVLARQLRATPVEVAADVATLQEVMRAALVEGQHYGTIPGTPRPTLYKAGAEWLLKWAGYGHELERVEVERHEQTGAKFAVTYRCRVHLLHDTAATVATCDGYAGYDESRWRASGWNTILKMAQKRALVGAALQATGASGLFTQDLEDGDHTAATADPWVLMGWTDKAEFAGRLKALVAAVKVHGGDEADALLARLEAERDRLKARPAEERIGTNGAPTTGSPGWPVMRAEMETLEAWVERGAPDTDGPDEGSGAPESDEPADAGPTPADAGTPPSELERCSGCQELIPADASRLRDGEAVFCETCLDEDDPSAAELPADA